MSSFKILLKKMGNNQKLNRVNVNYVDLHTKINQILSICSQDIERT